MIGEDELREIALGWGSDETPPHEWCEERGIDPSALDSFVSAWAREQTGWAIHADAIPWPLRVNHVALDSFLYGFALGLLSADHVG